MIDSSAIWQDVATIRERAPLVQNVTNFVVMDFTANALLALGASPVMAHAPEEAEAMAALAGAVVLNMGTLDASWVASLLAVRDAALKLNKPVVFDPVGAGATPFRTAAAKQLLESGGIAVVRGNASEIATLAGASGRTKGVDSLDESLQIADAVAPLLTSCDVVVISGAKDVVIGRDKRCVLGNGCAMMTRVTGMGCTATALIGAFLAIQPDPFRAAAHAMAVMGIAGQLARLQSGGPGSLRTHFLDTLYSLDESVLASSPAGGMMSKPFDPFLYLVTDNRLAGRRGIDEVVRMALEGGVTCVQLRDKTLGREALAAQASVLKDICHERGIPLIVNDDVEVAKLVGADGVHLGQSDVSVAQARDVLGDEAIVGLSVETLEQAREAARLDVNYLAASPVFATPTKIDTAEPLGLIGLRAIRAITEKPLVAIGGINIENARAVLEAGADGLAVISALVAALDPCQTARKFCSLRLRSTES